MSDTKVATLEQQVAELAEANFKLREDRRQDRITKAVDACQLPAIRPHVRALLEFTTVDDNAGRVVKFSELGTDNRRHEVDVVGSEVVTRLVEAINGYVAKMFKTFSEAEDVNANREREAPDGTSPEAVGAAIDKLVRDYMSKHADVPYSDALHAVLDEPANAGLRKLYHNL